MILNTVLDVSDAFNIAAGKHAELLAAVCASIRTAADEGKFIHRIEFVNNDPATHAQYGAVAIILNILGFVTEVEALSPTSHGLLVSWENIPPDFPRPKLGKFRSPTMLKG